MRLWWRAANVVSGIGPTLCEAVRYGIRSRPYARRGITAGPERVRYRGMAMLEASMIAAIRSRLYQTGVKPWTLAPWARTQSVSASSLDARSATLQRTGCTSAHRTSRVCSIWGVIGCPVSGHLPGRCDRGIPIGQAPARSRRLSTHPQRPIRPVIA